MPSNPLWLVAGWTMLHFLWVGSAIAMATLIARLVLRSVAPLVRYTITLMGFAALAVAPAVIAVYLWQQEPTAVQNPPLASLQAPELELAALENRSSAPLIDLAETPITIESQAAEFEPPTATFAAEPAKLPATAAEPTALNDVALDEKLVAVFDEAAEWLPLVWLIGAPLTFLLLATGLVGVERLRRDCQPVTSGPLYEALAAAAERLSISGRAALALSERVAQPMLIGVLRPVVLLPASAASGYSPEQLEMVLLHELAHVRRRDNLVNLGQRVIESLLFFHPAVWLVSRQLRADREQCCDALVVRLTDDPQSYAELLVAVAEQNTPLPLAASAMAAHPLARRVRRILQLEDEPMLVSKKFLLAVLAVGLGLTGACGYSFSQGPEAVAESANESVEEPDATPEETPAADPQDVEAESPEEEPALGNPHFLSLEDQRVSDLAYKMLGVEISRVGADLTPPINEAGFGGGIQVQFEEGGGFSRSRGDLKSGDILVGLHVWPTEDFDDLADVLRREDLDEFNPLKIYVLRPTPVVTPGDEMGGYGGGYGGRMGMQAAEPEMTYKLVTGRITFQEESWQEEQQRLKKLDETPLPSSSPKASGRSRYGGGELIWSPLSSGPTPAAAAPKSVPRESSNTTSTPPLAKLTYNGRSFEEWNTQWRTELSVKERKMAIQALTAFGRAGYEIEAVNAILDVAAVYDFSERRLSSIQGAIGEALLSTSQPAGPTAAPLEAWFPLLMNRYETDPERYASLVQEMVQRISRSLTPVEVDKSTYETICGLLDDPHTEVAIAALKTLVQKNERLEDPRVQDAWVRALQSDNLEERREALWLFHLPGNDGRTWTPLTDENIDEQWLRLLYQNLLHEDFSVRRLSRTLLGGASDHVKRQTADFLKQLLESPTESEFQCGLYPASGAAEIAAAKLAAVRGIAVVGPLAGLAESQLESVLESDDIKLTWAAAVALDTIDNGQIDASMRDVYGRLLDRQAETLFPGIGNIDREALDANRERIEKTVFELIRPEMKSSRSDSNAPAGKMWVDWYNRLPKAQESPNG